MSLAGAVFFPQLAFVCGVLAVLRVVRRRGESQLPAADLVVVRRRTAFALAGGGLTLASLAAFALDQHTAISSWWLVGSLVSLAVFAPLLAGVGRGTPLAPARPVAATGEGHGRPALDVHPRVPGVRPAVERTASGGAADGSRFSLPLSPPRGGGGRRCRRHDPLDGLIRAVAEGVAVLGCYRLLGRQLGLRR